MSKFTYEKVGQYGDEVVDYIKKKNGVVLAEAGGGTFTIDISDKSVFDKFAKMVKKRKYFDAADYARKNFFKVLEPKDRPKKYESLRWTQLEKKIFSSKNLSIETPQQEQITLLIIKNVLGSDTKSWKTFDEMFHAKGSKIKKIFPDLDKLDDWWDHFDLQFREIKGLSGFPNDKYDVYLYNGTDSFMQYITHYVTKDLDVYSQKDTWNPADIWLMKSDWKKKYLPMFNKIKEKLDESKKTKVKKKTYTGEDAIRELNGILKKAYKPDRDIVGISLKKSNLKKLKFTEFNLQANAKDQKLPNVDFDKIKLDVRYNEKKGFISKTSYFFVSDGKRGAYKCAYKSNTGQSLGNITYEFLPDGSASAFLGKVPKDKLENLFGEFIKENPNEGTMSPRIMPRHTLLPEEWSKDVEKEWKHMVSTIKGNFTKGLEAQGLDNFVENLKTSYTKYSKIKNRSYKQKRGGIVIENATAMQNVWFTYILALLKEKNKLINFVTMCYYFAQKKGQKWNFGPFGKLY
ncbi:MAG: hypothetical protein HOJ14_02945 [Nitrospina sp.]|nr:hypothetical protein [Nitrospina sp.]